jgi:hypothetical protein
MTPEQWLACTDPELMLEFLRGKATDRKLRLFACACCRHTWSLVDAEWRRMAGQGRARVGVELVKREADLAGKAAEVAERYADGLTTFEVLKELFSSPGDDEMEGCYADGADAAWAARASAYRARCCAKFYSPSSYRRGAAFRSPSQPDYDREQSAQCQLLRDIFGNSSSPAALDPAWPTATVTALARAAYNQRLIPGGYLDPARLAVLSDALEEAGCTDQAVLDHLRSPGPHVRGCWAVDALIARK